MTLCWHRKSASERKAVRDSARFHADHCRGLFFTQDDLCPRCHRLICFCSVISEQMAAIEDACRKMGEPKSRFRKLMGR